MCKSIRACVLILLLACSAQAGHMQNESPAPPSSQPATAVQEELTGGEIPNPQTTDGEMNTPAAATFLEVVLNLLALP